MDFFQYFFLVVQLGRSIGRARSLCSSPRRSWKLGFMEVAGKRSKKAPLPNLSKDSEMIEPGDIVIFYFNQTLQRGFLTLVFAMLMLLLMFVKTWVRSYMVCTVRRKSTTWSPARREELIRYRSSCRNMAFLLATLIKFL